jgi:hypothetical protein
VSTVTQQRGQLRGQAVEGAGAWGGGGGVVNARHPGPMLTGAALNYGCVWRELQHLWEACLKDANISRENAAENSKRIRGGARASYAP